MTQDRPPATATKQKTGASVLLTLWLPALLCAIALIGELYLVFNGIPENVQDQNLKLGPSVATYVSGKNEVRKKASGTLVWGQPEAGKKLFAQDAIATMSDSEAVLEFSDQTQIVIEPDSLVVLEAPPPEKKSFFDRLKRKKSAPITARIIKGSILRKSPGPAPLLLRFGDLSNAESVHLEDLEQKAVFRVVYRGNGVEISVQTGHITVNHDKKVSTQETLQHELTPPRLLPAPKLKRPKIRIDNKPTEESFLQWNFIPKAWAEEKTTLPNVTIDFNWEAIEGAREYQIQIAKDPQFSSPLVNQKAQGTTFEYNFESPSQPLKLFFRVAGIDASGTLGEFSAHEEINVKPIEIKKEPPLVRVTPPEPEKPKAPKAAPRKALPAPRPTPLPSPAAVPTPAPSPTPWIGHGEVAIGLLYESRKFQNDVNPLTANASGLIPSFIRAEYGFAKADKISIKAKGTALLQKAGTDASGASGNRAGTSVYGFSLVTGKKYFLAGPILTSTSRLQWNESDLVATRRWTGGLHLEGVIPLKLALPLSAKYAASWIFLNSLRGWELSLGQKYFFPKPRNVFASFEYRYRGISKVETSHAVLLEVGYGF